MDELEARIAALIGETNTCANELARRNGGWLPAKIAAFRLGVTEARISQLTRADPTLVRRVGNRRLIDSTRLEARRRNGG